MVAFVKNLGKKVVSLVKPEVKESQIEVNETPDVKGGYEKTTDKILLKNSYPRGFTKRTLRELKKGKTRAEV